MMTKKQKYFYNIALACDLMLNTVFGGSPRETCSIRLWRHRQVRGVMIIIRAINWVALYLFGQEDHCKVSLDDACDFSGQEVLE